MPKERERDRHEARIFGWSFGLDRRSEIASSKRAADLAGIANGIRRKLIANKLLAAHDERIKIAYGDEFWMAANVEPL